MDFISFIDQHLVVAVSISQSLTALNTIPGFLPLKGKGIFIKVNLKKKPQTQHFTDTLLQSPGNSLFSPLGTELI